MSPEQILLEFARVFKAIEALSTKIDQRLDAQQSLLERQHEELLTAITQGEP